MGDADSIITGLQLTNSKLMDQVHSLNAELAMKSQEIGNIRDSQKFHQRNDSEQATLQNNTKIRKNLLKIDNLTNQNDLNNQINHNRLDHQKNDQKHEKSQQNFDRNLEKLKTTTEKLNKTNQKLIFSNNQVQKLTSQLAKYEIRNNKLKNYLD